MIRVWKERDNRRVEHGWSCGPVCILPIPARDDAIIGRDVYQCISAGCAWGILVKMILEQLPRQDVGPDLRWKGLPEVCRACRVESCASGRERARKVFNLSQFLRLLH